jgi:tetratricopeptide (TPR) repeat protein
VPARRARHATGAPREAIKRLNQALNLCRETGDRIGQVHALNALGEVLLATGGPEQAVHRYRDALGLAVQIGAADEQIRARQGLAAARALSDQALTNQS